MLSVLIPSYNDTKNLPIALASALAVKSVSEIIVIDDNSIDDTKELIQHVKIENNQIKYIKNKKNLGSGLSFIKALENSSNPYIIMLNSDDFFVPQAIDNLLEFLKNNKLDVAYGKMAIKKESGIHNFQHPGYKKNSYIDDRNELKDLLIYDMYTPSFGSIIKKKSLNSFYNFKYYQDLQSAYGGYFKAHDYDLFINLAKRKKKFGFLNETVCVWCPKNESQSGNSYFESGEASYESSFLFNRYFKDENFDNFSLNLIFERINEKLTHKRNSNSQSNEKLSNHYNLFLKNINKSFHKIKK
mgnify:FL=1